MALTATEVRSLRTKGKFLDGGGLVLHVVNERKRYWVYRFSFDGREKSMSLGSAAILSLADARVLHAEARRKVMLGIDPLVERQRAKAARLATVSFAEAAERYIAAHRAGWRGRSEEHWRQTLTDHALPHLGQRPVDRVTVDDVLAVLSPIWSTKNVTASTVRSRVELVLSYAKARGWRSGENPARWRDHLDHLLPKPGRVHRIEHRPALDWREDPALMAALANDHSMASQCLRFLILTGARSGEARAATWGEFDLDAAVWTLPAEHMKARREHRVPLSEPALAIVIALAPVRTGALVFAGRVRGRPVSDNGLTRALRRAGCDGCTVHGFRSTFRDWCADTGQPADLAEMALAHQVGSAVERSYRRSDVLERRRLLMEQWARFLCREPVVVPLRQAG
jgi:integrase